MYDEHGEPTEDLITHWNEHNDHADDHRDEFDDGLDSLRAKQLAQITRRLGDVPLPRLDAESADNNRPDTPAELCRSTLLPPGSAAIYRCAESAGHAGHHRSADREYAWRHYTDDHPVPQPTIAALHTARARFDSRRAREQHADATDAIARVRAFLDTCERDGIDDDTPILDAVGYDITPGHLRALLPGEPTGANERPDGYDLFAHVTDITAWLDAANPNNPHEDAMRVLKLTEEAGEAAAAYIGMVGQNPPLTELNHSSAQVGDPVGRRSLAGSCMGMLSS